MPPQRKENINQESGESLANQYGTQVPQPERPAVVLQNEEADPHISTVYNQVQTSW